MSETKEIDLSVFCDAEGYPQIAKPWVENGRTYATDSKMAVRLDYEIPCDGKHHKTPNVEPLLEPVSSVTDWHDFPEVAICEECKNKYEIETECDECGGTQTVNCEYGHDHDCPECDDGTQLSSCDCYNEEVTLGTRVVAKNIIARASSLPGAKWGVTSSGPGDPLYIRFDGGIGVFMPLKKSPWR